MVVLEALSHGVPTVVSSAPYCGISAELCDVQEAVLLTNPLDARALAHALHRVLSDAVLVARLHENGLAFAHRHLRIGNPSA